MPSTGAARAAYDALKQRRRRQRRKDAGQCTHCAKPANAGTKCIECADRRNDEQRDRYREKIETGQCVRCPSPRRRRKQAMRSMRRNAPPASERRAKGATDESAMRPMRSPDDRRASAMRRPRREAQAKASPSPARSRERQRNRSQKGLRRRGDRLYLARRPPRALEMPPNEPPPMPHNPDNPDSHARRLAWRRKFDKARRERRKATGLCAYCERRRVKGRLACQKCLDRRARNETRRRSKTTIAERRAKVEAAAEKARDRIARGVCQECPDSAPTPAVWGKTRCERHLAIRREYKRAEQARKVAERKRQAALAADAAEGARFGEGKVRYVNAGEMPKVEPRDPVAAWLSRPPTTRKPAA